MINLIHHIRSRKFNATILSAYVLFFLAGGILTLSTVFLFTNNVDVLKNWVLVLPNQDIHEGDTITIASQYIKVRAVTGVATRYLECQNTQGISIRYPLNNAVADRAPGNTGTGITIKVPNTIPNPPAKCRFSINVLYHIYPLKNVTEFVASKWFTLLPLASSQPEPQSATQTTSSQTLTQSQPQSIGTVPSSNSTPSTPAAQSNNSQPSDPPATQAPRGLDALPGVGSVFKSIGL